MLTGGAIRKLRISHGLSQEALAVKVNIDRSALSRMETDDRPVPFEVERSLATFDWRFALQVADERTGGFIGNILGHLPNLDLHPAALKDALLKEVDELETALGGLVMARHIDPEKRKENAERVWYDLRDVTNIANVLQGVIEEEFGLNRKLLIEKHEMQIKNGER